VDDGRIGLLGATSLVGECLLPLLAQSRYPVVAFFRKSPGHVQPQIEWQKISPNHKAEITIPNWICLAPIWVLPDYFDLLKSSGARRVVALSSTSRFTKSDSGDVGEREVAQKLTEGESRLQSWAGQNGIEFIILRPTLVYGLGRDKNISEIARFIRRFRFFPLFGSATGLRQPVHAEDVAQACYAALAAPAAANKSYNISGAETLTYRAMVCKVFTASGRPPRLLAVPVGVFRCALCCLHFLPRYRHWSASMAERMNRDQVFDHSSASQDFGFNPRDFHLGKEDIVS
jgi:nucleoside-diphosphate-sugar epimerase